MEVSAVDPNLGGVFYSLDQTPEGGPKLTRATQDCLQCHVSGRAMGVPWVISVRSLHTDGGGDIVAGTDTGAESPAHAARGHRWGGWYVTGQHGDQTHLGNLAGLIRAF